MILKRVKNFFLIVLLLFTTVGLSHAKNIKFSKSQKSSKIFLGFSLPYTSENDDFKTLLVSFGKKKPTIGFIIPYEDFEHLPKINSELIKSDIEIFFAPSFALKFHITDFMMLTV